jgi:hypothetical protein
LDENHLRYERWRAAGAVLGAAAAVSAVALGAGLAWNARRRARAPRWERLPCRRTRGLGAHLLVGFYEERDPDRMAEYTTCLARNLDCCDIERVHVFDETRAAGASPRMSVLGHPRMERVLCGRRTRFQDFFEYAARELPGRTVIIANTDVFFDETLGELAGYPMDGRLLALSRWDERADGSSALFEEPGSQDAWIFRAPLRPFPCDWYLGVPGCDNRLAWEARNAGLDVTNPARTVRARHLHLTGRRNYSGADLVEGPMCGVAIGSL